MSEPRICPTCEGPVATGNDSVHLVMVSCADAEQHDLNTWEPLGGDIRDCFLDLAAAQARADEAENDSAVARQWAREQTVSVNRAENRAKYAESLLEDVEQQRVMRHNAYLEQFQRAEAAEKLHEASSQHRLFLLEQNAHQESEIANLREMLQATVEGAAAAQARVDELTQHLETMTRTMQAKSDEADELETQLNRLLPVVEGATGGFKDTIKSLLDYKDRADEAEAVIMRNAQTSINHVNRLEAAERQVVGLRAALSDLATFVREFAEEPDELLMLEHAESVLAAAQARADELEMALHTAHVDQSILECERDMLKAANTLFHECEIADEQRVAGLRAQSEALRGVVQEIQATIDDFPMAVVGTLKHRVDAVLEATAPPAAELNHAPDECHHPDNLNCPCYCHNASEFDERGAAFILGPAAEPSHTPKDCPVCHGVQVDLCSCSCHLVADS